MIYAVGDIHGCHDMLLVAVAKIKAHASARPYRVIFLGDYVDRGPDSRRVVNLIRGLTGRSDGKTYGKWEALKGNHEVMMACALIDTLTDFWHTNGGLETVKSYEGHKAEMLEHSKWLVKLPAIIQTEHHCFVHAGVSPRYSLDDQPEEVLLWIRGWEKDEHNFGKHIVYGHTPFKDGPKLLQHSTGLDTGAYYGGPLTVGVFDETKPGGPVEILQAL